jgi:dipeptidyl aminopeptidase/acylaminoacyl peptidase
MWAGPLEAQLRPITYDDYYRIQTVGSTRISPDGSSVAFTVSRAIEDENRTRSGIWIVTTDGEGEPRRLTSPTTSATDPRWSADGRLLAFNSSRWDSDPEVDGDQDPETSTWFLRMDTPGEAFQIEGVGGAPIFDPTNRWIVFTKGVLPEGQRPESRPTSEETRKIVERFDGREYDWMQFRYDRRGYLDDPRDPWATPPEEIFIVPLEGGEPLQLTDLGVDAEDVSWGPDGNALVFTADTHQRDEHTYERADLWTVSTGGGGASRLTDDAFHYSAPAWSPDGAWIVALGRLGLDVVIDERWDHGAPSDLWLFSADGSERRNLTEAWDLVPGDPTWSGDGQSVYFIATVGGDRHVFRVSVTDGRVEQVTQGAVRVASLSFSADFATVAYVRQHPTDPGNVLAGPVGAETQRLTDMNAELRSELDLQSPERITFQSPDGTEIEGWVLPPVGFDAGSDRRWPMILNMHGGPHGSYGTGFSFQFQLQAARGYFVLYANPRASVGYGEAFRWGTWGSWGDEDYDDVMAGVDHAVATYPVDPGRLGVTGYSYGGYLTNWVITQTDRFSAAVAGAGISNWMSDYAVADIPRTKESEFYGTPWEEEGLRNLLAASPIVHAEGVSTPTLFVHGESDFRVPIEEAEQMYVALQKQGVPAKMIRYPDSYHGGWKPWRYVHRLYSTIEWFDRWLGEKPVS